MFVTLPLEVAARTDLFAKPLHTLDELRRRHPDAGVEELDRPADAPWPAMAQLERALFANPRDPTRLTASARRLAATASRFSPRPSNWAKSK